MNLNTRYIDIFELLSSRPTAADAKKIQRIDTFLTIPPGRQPTKQAIAANNYPKPRTNNKQFFRSFKLLCFPWLHNSVKCALLNP